MLIIQYSGKKIKPVSNKSDAYVCLLRFSEKYGKIEQSIFFQKRQHNTFIISGKPGNGALYGGSGGFGLWCRRERSCRGY